MRKGKLIVTDGEQLFEVTNSLEFFKECTDDDIKALYAQLYMFLRTISILEGMSVSTGESETIDNIMYTLNYFTVVYPHINFRIEVEQVCNEELEALREDLL